MSTKNQDRELMERLHDRQEAIFLMENPPEATGLGSDGLSLPSLMKSFHLYVRYVTGKCPLFTSYIRI